MTREEKEHSIHGIPVLTDNIIWVWVSGKQAIAVDPAIADPVKKWIKARGLNLIAILQTHHHEDHIGGTKELLNDWPDASVIAAKNDLERIPFQTISVSDGEKIHLMGLEVKVLEVKGHTNAHICYYINKKEGSCKMPLLFCGDTIFGAGCGRIFEGTFEEMFCSINKLSALPQQTKLFCAHEYTESNLKWAANLYPNDLKIKARLRYTVIKRSKGELSLPSTIKEEQETNLFFRAKDLNEFIILRKNKDSW